MLKDENAIEQNKFIIQSSGLASRRAMSVLKNKWHHEASIVHNDSTASLNLVFTENIREVGAP